MMMLNRFGLIEIKGLSEIAEIVHDIDSVLESDDDESPGQAKAT